MASITVPRQAVSEQDLVWQFIGGAERFLAAVLLLGLSPVWLPSAMLLGWLSGLPPFIAHRRVGWRGATLWMLKLRTMWNEGERSGPRVRGWVERIDDEHGPQKKQAGDPRVNNWFARFCRKHSIDEIPQLWHVVRGDMALIGPRPVTEGEIRRHYAEDADELLRIKPGIAGLWQTSGRNRLSYAQRRRLDLHFVRNRSVRMYARILLRTLSEVLSGENTW